MSFESQAYQPSEEEIKAAENMMTNEQEQQSVEREQYINRVDADREKSDKEYKEKADEKNRGRAMIDKVRNKNKVSFIDMAFGEALVSDKFFDKKKEEENDLQKSIQESFKEEKKLAELGEWSKTSSRFGSFLGSKAEDERLGYEKNLNELSGINTQVLNDFFNEEIEEINNGEWKAKNSKLFVPNYNQSEVDDLKRQKHALYSALEQKQKEFKIVTGEEERSKILGLFASFLSTEKIVANNGLWAEKSSSFQPYLENEDRQIQINAQKNISELSRINQEKISETEKEKAKKEFQKELVQAGMGKWAEENSYFTLIQQEDLFELFDSELKSYIFDKIDTLVFTNFENRYTETEREGVEMSKETASDILGIDLKTPLDDAEKAYRSLIMKNHPDRGGDVEMAKKIIKAWEVFKLQDK